MKNDTVASIILDLAHERNGYNQNRAGYVRPKRRDKQPCTWCGYNINKSEVIHSRCLVAKKRCADTSGIIRIDDGYSQTTISMCRQDGCVFCVNHTCLHSWQYVGIPKT